MKHMLRTGIAELKAYEAHTIAGNIKFDANENPFPWPAGMREELLAAPLEFNRYPDGKAMALRDAIAGYNGVRTEEVLTGNGSDELITVILNTFGGDGRKLLIHPPTFGMYANAAAITGTGVMEIPLLKGTKLDLEPMCAAARRDDMGVIIICNPNNPTGTLFPRADILEIVKSTRALVVIDEAYIEFAGESLVALIHEYPNLMIMKTFSKAFGMAALRLGYVIADSRLIDYLNRVRQPFNVNSFSQQAGIIAIRYATEYRKQVETIKNEINMLYNEFKKIPGWKVLETRANFILFQPPNPDQWFEALAASGFTVRNLGDLPGLGKCLRLSSGLPDENKALLEAVNGMIEKQRRDCR